MRLSTVLQQATHDESSSTYILSVVYMCTVEWDLVVCPADIGPSLGCGEYHLYGHKQLIVG